MNDRIEQIYRHEMGWIEPNMPAYHIDEWMLNKRTFTADEVTAGVWVKVSEHGQTFLLYLHKNGDLTEKPVFTKNEWGGSWKFVDGVLRIKIDKHETDVIASKDGPVHSAMQFVGNQPQAYFKFIHAV